MFCHQCGSENPDQASFCIACGTETVRASSKPSDPSSNPPPTGPRPLETDRDPTVVLKPVFLPGLTVLQVLPLQIFMTIWGAGFCGGFGLFAIKGLSLPIPTWTPFVFFGLLFFLGIPLVVLSTARKTVERTEYRFFRDRLEYFEGFFTVEEKSIPLASVIEVQLTKGPLQSKHGLGTVVLATPAGWSNRRAGGIRVHNIEDPDEVYRRVKELVERARGGERRRAA